MEYPQRKLHRLKDWDYSQNGYYFVTICTAGKRKLLSNIHQADIDSIVIPTAIGKMVIECWERIAQVYPGVKLDYYCLMPNHLHAILILEDQNLTLSKIIQGFKSVTTRQYNRLVPPEEKNTLWQASFYDEIIRNDEMLFDIRKYIFGNPSKWLEDKLYVE